ncbi:Alpha/beta hydrolase [Giardia duodenalis]|uniref:Alpha/beta hydrolase n=1 Tax=Giardia intestinalis TaxID=5741 RepID=V6TTG0_GIAIN|nr:Alpha/beta hydrolase [Giardia intestinalis]
MVEALQLIHLPVNAGRFLCPADSGTWPLWAAVSSQRALSASTAQTMTPQRAIGLGRSRSMRQESIRRCDLHPNWIVVPPEQMTRQKAAERMDGTSTCASLGSICSSCSEEHSRAAILCYLPWINSRSVSRR